MAKHWDSFLSHCIYIECVAAIKKGDICQVMNVLQVWMIMMCTPKIMPWYADIIFKTFDQVKGYPECLQWVPVIVGIDQETHIS